MKADCSYCTLQYALSYNNGSAGTFHQLKCVTGAIEVSGQQIDRVTSKIQHAQDRVAMPAMVQKVFVHLYINKVVFSGCAAMHICTAPYQSLGLRRRGVSPPTQVPRTSTRYEVFRTS
jgi:hypothetical protein